MQFLFLEAALPFFSPGTPFTVWEGKLIGHGIVRERVERAAAAHCRGERYDLILDAVGKRKSAVAMRTPDAH